MQLDAVLHEGIEFMRRGHWEGAGRNFAQILSLDPTNPNALNLLGLVRKHQGFLDEAERLFQAAIHAFPEAGGFWLNLGNLLAARGRSLEAIPAYISAIQVEPMLLEADRAFEIAWNGLPASRRPLPAVQPSFWADSLHDRDPGPVLEQRPKGVPMVSIVVQGTNLGESGPRMLAALRAQLPECPRCFVLDRSTDGTADFLAREGEQVLVKSEGRGPEPASARNLGLGRTDPNHDVLFLDGDRVPEGLSLPLLEAGMREFDICLLRTRQERFRTWFSEGFQANPSSGFLVNGVFGCALAIRRSALQAICRLQNGLLFHPVFDGHAGEEDGYLGDVAYHLGLSIGGFPMKAAVAGTIQPYDAETIVRFGEQLALRSRLRQFLRVRQESEATTFVLPASATAAPGRSE